MTRTENVPLNEPVLFCILIAIIGATFYIKSILPESAAIVTVTSIREPDKKAHQIAPHFAIQTDKPKAMIATIIPTKHPFEELEDQNHVKTNTITDTIIATSGSVNSARNTQPTIEVVDPSLRRARDALGHLEEALEEAAQITIHSRTRSEIIEPSVSSHSS